MVKLDEKNKKHYQKVIIDSLIANNRKVFRATFLDLHPYDQAALFSSFTEEQRKKGYEFLTPLETSLLFENLSTDDQIRFFSEMDEDYSAEMLNSMFIDDVVMFLTEIQEDSVDEILDTIDEDKAEEIEIILSYEPETAGAIMTKEFISISSFDTADNVIDMLRKEAPDAEVIYYNYVVDPQGVLVGVVSLRDLISAQPEAKIEDIMNSRVVSVFDDMDQEEVAEVIQKYDLLAVPVISKDSRLLGIVTVDDIIDIIEDETTEDFEELSATKGSTDINLSAFTAALKRSPWIITLMFLGLLTAGVISYFEDTLNEVIILAIFIPMIMNSAGNVGIQSLGVAVRGIALGTISDKDLWKLVRREFGTGLLIGILSMTIICIIIPIFYDVSWLIGIIVGVSLLGTLTVSSVVGAVVPFIINKLKFDPAIASGPFITTLNDIVGLIIYFSIATTLINYI